MGTISITNKYLYYHDDDDKNDNNKNSGNETNSKWNDYKRANTAYHNKKKGLVSLS